MKNIAFTDVEITDFLDTLKTYIVYPYKLAYFVDAKNALNFCFVHEGIFNGLLDLIVNDGDVWFRVFKSKTDNRIRFHKVVYDTLQWQFFKNKDKNSNKQIWKSFADVIEAAAKMAQYLNNKGICPTCYSNIPKDYYFHPKIKNFAEAGGNNIKIF